MRTRIKFCGLVRPDDVEAACALGVDAVGLVFYARSPRFLSDDEAAALRRRLPSFVAAVGLFVNAPPDRIALTHARVGLDVLQFHGDETPAQCRDPRLPALPWWRAVRMRAPDDLLESTVCFTGAEAWVLDAHAEGYGGSGRGFDWSWIRDDGSHRLILSGGLTPRSVGDAIARVGPWAVDVSSGIEGATPREKDHARMRAFAEAVADADLARRRAAIGDAAAPGTPNAAPHTSR